MFDPVIAPSGTLLGLLQRGRGDGTLHALTAPRAEALAALNHCVLSDPRHDWQVENRSLYYARLYLDLHGELGEIERHLFDPDDVLNTDESRTGLALAVLGHLASYGRRDALELLRRYAAFGASWAWALDELALRDDDAGLRVLAAPILDRFPEDPEGDAELAAAVRDAYEPRPWRLWADDPREAIGARVRAAQERGSFDQWQRQMRPAGPRPGWSVRAVFDWAQEGLERGAVLYVPAARCLTAVAGPDDRAEIVQAALTGHDGARSTALRYLADNHDPDVLDLIEAAVESPSHAVVDAALDAFERMRTVASLERARRWAPRPDALGAAAGRMLACRGGAQDTEPVLAALREAVRGEGADAPTLWPLVDGAGRLGIASAAPVLRHVYRETASSHLRGHAARALAATDPSFAAGFAVECLWDCEESTREVAARHAETGDARVVDQLRRLAADPAEEAEVQTAVRSRIGPDATAL
ncbi:MULTISPECIES: HEAT repeat domain-containing protein [unclassified Streptomyces]|uniref:HEAT repeat domain-containing protein n=1 Tax=unclassified Streptomyces TaxID=2593676 RepID=UPI002DDA26E1|nr:HEAT repeat domain-containing protein [Streptomyces sp. NBC_01445]WSE08504.1 HEAT repeat domain-containing protein [Streptomyces sp. NBC_01445]